MSDGTYTQVRFIYEYNGDDEPYDFKIPVSSTQTSRFDPTSKIGLVGAEANNGRFLWDSYGKHTQTHFEQNSKNFKVRAQCYGESDLDTFFMIFLHYPTSMENFCSSVLKLYVT